MRVLALIVTEGFAVAVAQDVQVRPTLIPGDEFTIDITRNTEDTTQPESAYSSTTPVMIRVVTATAEGFTLDWRPGGTTGTGVPGEADLRWTVATQASSGVTFRLVLKPDGHFAYGVDDPAAVAKLAAAFDRMLGALHKITAPDDRQRVDDLLRPLTPGHAVVVVKTHVELCPQTPHRRGSA